jgi:hypothetical protein
MTRVEPASQRVPCTSPSLPDGVLCRCVNEWQGEIARALHGNHQHEAFGGLVPQRERPARILARDPVDHCEVWIGPLLDDAAAELSPLSLPCKGCPSR